MTKSVVIVSGSVEAQGTMAVQEYAADVNDSEQSRNLDLLHI